MNPIYLYMPRPFIIRFHKQQYRFSMYLFSTMVNARTLADLVSRVRLIKLLLCSKVQSQSNKPELFASILQNWLPTAPFWTALLLGMCMIKIIIIIISLTALLI